MGIRKERRKIEHRVRSSMEYHTWVEANLGPACVNCDATEHLKVHHVVSLYHVLLGLWRLYGDVETVVRHAIAMHADNICEGVTLCDRCHDLVHPGKRVKEAEADVRIENWTVLPRHLPGPFLHHPSMADKHGMTLLATQTLAAIGWYVLNGRLKSRILEFNSRSLALLLGKTPGTSWSHGLSRALDTMEQLQMIVGWHMAVSEVEVHISKDYLEALWSPWFVGMRDIRTSKMPVLALRWVLGLQSNRRVFRIGPKKLATWMGLTTQKPSFVVPCVERSCREIPWATCEYDGKNIVFRITRRGAVPIWTLRSTLTDAIREGL